MPVLDTQVLFALNPRDPKHSAALKVLRSEQELVVTDTSILEFELVLKARGRKDQEIKESLLALSEFFSSTDIKEEKTIDLDLLVLSSEIQSKNGLSFLDSLIAASALSLDSAVVGDDKAFDQVSELKRVPIK